VYSGDTKEMIKMLSVQAILVTKKIENDIGCEMIKDVTSPVKGYKISKPEVPKIWDGLNIKLAVQDRERNEYAKSAPENKPDLTMCNEPRFKEWDLYC
jgi:hypothetical protein